MKTQRIFVSLPADQWLTKQENKAKWAIVTAIEKLGYAITRAGGKPKYTEYKGEGHLIWTKVVNEPELLPWMFSQKRN